MTLTKSGLLNKTAISSLILTFALMAEGSELPRPSSNTLKQPENANTGLFMQMQQDMDNKDELVKAMNKSLEHCFVVEKKDGLKTVLSCPFAAKPQAGGG